MKKIFYISSFILFLFACLLHFVYDFFNQSFLIGIISPINESIFEHTKLILVPLTIFYTMYFIINKNKLNINKYFFSFLMSILLGIILVPMFYYGYTKSFGFESVVIDISITFIVMFLSNVFFLNYYLNYKFFINYKICILLIIWIYCFYIYATFSKISFPLFN